jgi:hypothetical protein
MLVSLKNDNSFLSTDSTVASGQEAPLVNNIVSGFVIIRYLFVIISCFV